MSGCLRRIARASARQGDRSSTHGFRALGGRLVEGFAQQLGAQVERESGNEGTIVRLTLPSREPSKSIG